MLSFALDLLKADLKRDIFTAKIRLNSVAEFRKTYFKLKIIFPNY